MRSAAFFTVLLATQVAVHGQQRHFTYPIAAGYPHVALAAAGDIDADGCDDLATGMQYLGGFHIGAVLILSGRDGRVLRQFSGTLGGEEYGESIAAVGDLNRDGVPDIAATGGGNGYADGYVKVQSGVDGATLHLIQPTPGRHDPFFLGHGGDIDGDGFTDLVVSWPDILTLSSFTTAVWSGRDARRLFERTVPDWIWGTCLGDVNGDGCDDLAIADREFASFTGRVTVISGRDQSELYSMTGAGPNGAFGQAVSGLGDIDGDGCADFAVGAPGIGAPGLPSVDIYSGVTGARIRTLLGTRAVERFGTSIANAGDADGDRVDDVVVGAPYVYAGSAKVFSGATGEFLYEVVAVPGEGYLGSTVSGAGDLDGDGFADIAVGCTNPSGGLARVVAVVSRVATGQPGRERRRGVACLGTASRWPHIGFTGSADLDSVLGVSLRAARPNFAAVLHIGDTLTLPLDFIGMTSCTLLASPLVSVGIGTNAAGAGGVQVLLAPDVAPVGHTFAMQWAVWDPGANAIGATLTEALDITLGLSPKPSP